MRRIFLAISTVVAIALAFTIEQPVPRCANAAA
jgi:hypothetical protein